MVSLKIEKPIGLAFWLFLSGYSEFLNVNDMTVVYPNGIIDIIPWENGNVDKKNIQRFLTALLKDGESETRRKYCRTLFSKQKNFLLILMTKKYKKALP